MSRPLWQPGEQCVSVWEEHPPKAFKNMNGGLATGILLVAISCLCSMNITWKTQKLVSLPRSLLAKHRRPSYWLWGCFLVLSEAWMEGFKNVSFCFWNHSCGKNSTSLWYLKTKIAFIAVFLYTTTRPGLLYDRINQHARHISVTWIWTLESVIYLFW